MRGATDHHRARTIALALVATGLVLAACGDDGTTPASQSGPPPRAAEVEAIWAEDDPTVHIATPTNYLLPGPDAPDGTVLAGLGRPDPDLNPGPVEDLLASDDVAAQTLYADPDGSDPLAGRTLMVGRSALSDTDTGLSVQGTEEVEIDGDRAHLREVDGLSIVIWSLPPSPTLSCGCDQQGFVAGRGVTRAELMAAARAATVTGPQPSLPATVVDGLRSLGTTTGAVWPAAVAGPQPQALTVRLASGHEVDLAVRTGDARLLPHSRIWAPGGEVIWPGWDRRIVVRPGPEGTVVWATAPDDVPEQEVEDLIASLVPATEADVEVALDEIASVPLTPCDLELGAGPNATRADIFGATADGTRWAVGLMLQDEALLTCDRFVPRGEPDGGSAGGGGGPAPSFAPPLGLRPLGSTGLGDGRGYYTVAGFVDSRSTRVLVQTGDVPPVKAEMATTGPTDDRRWFAVVIEAPEGPPTVPLAAVAYAADGTELGRAQR